MASRQRLAAAATGVAGCLLLATVVALHAGGSGELLAGARAARLEHRHGVVRDGSQLADLVDSPLMLAKQKIDQYLNEDGDNLVEQARKMNVVGSEHAAGAPCTSLKCDNGVWQNDYLQTSEDRMEKVGWRHCYLALRSGKTPVFCSGKHLSCPPRPLPCVCAAPTRQVLNGEDPGKKPLSDAEQAQYIDAEKEFAVSLAFVF
jgi:hypothetical protein